LVNKLVEEIEFWRSRRARRENWEILTVVETPTLPISGLKNEDDGARDGSPST
jgi:hypothetical protein